MGVQTVHPEGIATALIVPPTGGAAKTFSSDRAEKPASSLIVPSRRPQAAADAMTFPGSETAPPMVTNAPAALGTIVIGSATLVVSAIPAARVTFGPHVESPVLVAVGAKIMTMGVPGTYGDTVIAIKTVAGGITVAVLGNTQNGQMQTVALTGGISAAREFAAGAADRVLWSSAPPPIALPQQDTRPRVTIGGTVLTSAADGGFFVAGTSLTPGGAPITVYGSTGTGESAGSAFGNKASPTVLSLTTNEAGGEVLVVNGKTSDLPTAPSQTGKPKPAQYNGYESSSNSGIGPGSTIESGGGGNADHKNSALGMFSRIQRTWGCGLAMSFMAMIS